jgi:hypothetical protein
MLTLVFLAEDQLTVRPIEGRLVCGDRLGSKTPGI